MGKTPSPPILYFESSLVPVVNYVTLSTEASSPQPLANILHSCWSGITSGQMKASVIVSATSSALTALSSRSVPRGRQPGPPRGSSVYLHVCASTSTIKRGRWTSRNLELLASSYFYEKMMGKEKWVLERHSLLSVMQL